MWLKKIDFLFYLFILFLHKDRLWYNKQLYFPLYTNYIQSLNIQIYAYCLHITFLTNIQQNLCYDCKGGNKPCHTGHHPLSCVAFVPLAVASWGCVILRRGGRFTGNNMIGQVGAVSVVNTISIFIHCSLKKRSIAASIKNWNYCWNPPEPLGYP